MDVEQPGWRPTPADSVGHPHAHWPARTQRLIGEIRGLCDGWLPEALRASLGDFDTRLFQQADHTRSHLDQQRYLITRQRLLKERQAFDQTFAARIHKAFDELGAVAPAPAAAAGNQPLSLLDPMEHELIAALDQLVARSEARSRSILIELGYRLAVLVGAPPLEGEALPLGPQTMATAFRDASKALDLPGEHELLLVQSLEKSLTQGLGQLCEKVNAHLQADGILPHLRTLPTPRAAVRRTRPVDVDDAGAERSPASTEAPRSEPIAVLDNLRELLARQRASQGTNQPGGARSATTEELETALGALQQHISQVSDHVSRELRSAQRLREELLSQLNAGRPAGAAHTDLSPEQDDTVELVARLFEQMGQQLQQGGSAQSLLGGLQLPLLRVAVADRGFFDKREHPARQLLGTVTEAAHDWLDDAGGEADRSLRAKLEQLVERASREPPSAGLYTTLLADIEQHLSLLRRKAQVTERRHVEAMQGRERLEQARRRAAELMAERFAQAPPRGLLRTLLDRAWSDVLALTLLRHGEDSDAFATRLVITDQLLGRLPAGDLRRLQQEVESGLQQIGMHGDEAVQVAQRLIGAGTETPDANSPTTTTLALRLKQHQRLGEQASDSAPARAAIAKAAKSPSAAAPAPAVAAAAPRPSPASELPRTPMPTVKAKPAAEPERDPSPQEKRIHQRLRELPYGSWFEFVDPASGRVTQRKLAWYSPMSGNSLFVTRRGQRAEELTLAQLAHEIACGRVRETPPGHEGMLDRAWRALTRSLGQNPRLSTSGAHP
jgi:hypothetical protein